MRHFPLLILSFLLLADGLHSQTPPKKEKEYLDRVISLIEANYYFIDSIDFLAVKSKAISLMSFAKKRADTYSVIDTILRNLYEGHHFFLRPQVMKKLDQYEPLVYPTGRLIDDQTGYIKIPPMLGHFTSIQAWSDSLRNIYDELQNPDIKGWIIDLRGNKGGAMGPMITGLYPFFGDTAVLSLKHKSGGISVYSFKNGYFTETKNGVEYGLLTYKKGPANFYKNKIAVLIDDHVGSSGEITAIALRGLNNTRFFGAPTGGVPTSTWSYRLSDKAYIGFVEGVHFDRNGK